MVRMSQDWKNREILVEMHGNNGSMDGDPPAAMRYTEARLSEMAGYLLQDIEKDTVPLLGTLMIPRRSRLFCRQPSLTSWSMEQLGFPLVMQPTFPPHNLAEVIDAVIYMIDHPSAKVDKLMEFLPGQTSRQEPLSKVVMRSRKPMRLVKVASWCAPKLRLKS